MRAVKPGHSVEGSFQVSVARQSSVVSSGDTVGAKEIRPIKLREWPLVPLSHGTVMRAVERGHSVEGLPIGMLLA